MKSAMSTKVYWKARKLIQSIGFRCKSLLYTYMDRAEVIKESSSIKHVIARQALKEGIRGVIWAFIALILDVVFQQILNISADNRRVFVSVIICTIGVAGVILFSPNGPRQEYCDEEDNPECRLARKRKNRQDCDARKRQAKQND